jgi:hypothetical protein
MSVNWQELEISQAELEELINFDLLSSWAIDLSRVLLLKLKTYRRSLLLTEGCSLFSISLFVFPINLIIFRNFNWLSNNTSGLILVLATTALVSISILLYLNYYLWLKAKRLKVFAILLEKVKQYNDLINNLKLVTELNSLNSDRMNSEQQEIVELKTALSLTKNSLIKSIELEKVINRDRHIANNRYQLLANLESGLVNLNLLSQNNSHDYQQLLSEAIELGLSVHQEIRKTQTLRQ